MSKFFNRYTTALPLLSLVAFALAVTGGSQPTYAHHLCGNTGSPYGAFDIQTYEAADYRNVYARTMELAGWNRLFPEYPTFAPPAMETGDRGAGSGSLMGPYIPPVLLKSIAWIESGWAQASYDPPVQYGQIGPVLSSHDCGYGIMQVTSGMQNVSGVPTLDQAMIGGHYAFNIARGARILAEKWNGAPEYRPIVGTRNPTVIEDWYYALWGYNGFAFKNHPLNPDYAWPRPAYDCGSARSYPYQELILGCAQNPPARGGSQLWNSQPVTLPNLSDPAFYDHLKLENWNPCSSNLQCAAMDIPTPNPAHQDPSGTDLNRGQVLGSPSLGLSTSNVVLSAVPGSQSPPARIDVLNRGSGLLSWRATSTAAWLKVSPYQGVALGADLGPYNGSFAIQADTASLLPGTYTAQVVLESGYATGVPARINVTLNFGDGAVMRLPDGSVYVLQSGLARHVPDGATFEAYGFSWASVLAVPQDWLTGKTRGQDLPSVLADGRLIRGPDGGTYAMQAGRKRWITGPAAFAACGYGWDSVSSVSGPTVGQIPNGAFLGGAPCPQPSFPDGTLLRTSDGGIWVTVGNGRRWVTSGQAMWDCFYQWGNVNGLGDSLVTQRPIFPNVESCKNEGSILRRADGSVYLVRGGLNHHVPNGPTFEANGLDWTRATPVDGFWLPVGDPLLDVLMNGRLLHASGKVYVMDGGVRRWVASAAVFNACGYNWGAISNISAGTLSTVPEGPPLQSPPCPALTLPIGTLLRGSDTAVWTTLGPNRKWVMSPEAIADCGYNGGNVQFVPDGLLAAMPAIGAVQGCTTERSLVLTRDGRVSVVRSGLRRWVPNPATLEANGLSWGSLAPMADGRLWEGRPLIDALGTGMLVRSPEGAVYVMQSGAKRHVPSPAVMDSCGYGWDAVVTYSAATIAAIPDGLPLSTPPCPKPSFTNGTLLWTSDGGIWAVQSGQRRWVASPAMFGACGYLPGNVDRLADSTIFALPRGPDLSSPPCP
ncbi:MAG: hypothetical protein E6I03_07745 [Chloroflexi bacterium]|nr:MAG: hypothetical protein E6I03_07745 [Chloroflexota bacterium]